MSDSRNYTNEQDHHMFSRILTLLLTLSILAACGTLSMNDSRAAAPSNTTPVATLQTLSISDAWVRSSPTGDNSAAYLTITNSGTADTLIAAKGDVAMMIELHTVTNDNGMMNMHPAEGGVPIPANSTQMLKSGGFHVMIMGLTSDLAKGQTIQLTLTFQNAGAVVVPFAVR
jgi:copper(I)-binding protein